MKKSVCAIIVTYNRIDVLKKSIDFILAQTIQPSTIIIVDNNSNDGTLQYIHSLQRSNGVKGVFLDKNIGYAGGIAHGLKYALSLDRYDYFWIMDDDSFYDKNTLNELVVNIEESDFAMIGLTGFNFRFGKKVKSKCMAKLQKIDSLLIDGALVRAEVVHRVGLPSEKFFMMCEDHEYCIRLRRHGFRLGLLTIDATQRLHLGGGGRFTRSTLWRGYYHSRNHLLIIKDNFSIASLFGYIILQTKLIIAAALFAPDRVSRVKLRFIGIYHGLIGVGGKTLDPASLKFVKK